MYSGFSWPVSSLNIANGIVLRAMSPQALARVAMILSWVWATIDSPSISRMRWPNRRPARSAKPPRSNEQMTPSCTEKPRGHRTSGRRRRTSKTGWLWVGMFRGINGFYAYAINLLGPQLPTLTQPDSNTFQRKATNSYMHVHAHAKTDALIPRHLHSK